MIVNPGVLDAYKDQYNAVLVARVQNALVDKLSDTAIETSIAYNIDGGALTLSHLSTQKLRYPIGQSANVELNLVVLPKTISPDQILKLADVKMLGGKIIASAGQMVQGIAPVTPLPAQAPQGIGPGTQP